MLVFLDVMKPSITEVPGNVLRQQDSVKLFLVLTGTFEEAHTNLLFGGFHDNSAHESLTPDSSSAQQQFGTRQICAEINCIKHVFLLFATEADLSFLIWFADGTFKDVVMVLGDRGSCCGG